MTETLSLPAHCKKWWEKMVGVLKKWSVLNFMFRTVWRTKLESTAGSTLFLFSFFPQPQQWADI